jgi:IKI3 family
VHNNETVGAVQLYYRGNYHWYLKQQWVGSGLKCLGFDSETVGRLFMVQSNSENVPDTTGCCGRVRSALRIADLSWDVTVSGTTDGSVAVTDGSSLLLTPLALNNVPPPMSMYKHTLPATCRQSFFWPRPSGTGWGLGCLLDDDRVQLVFSDSLGKPTGQVDIDVSSIISSLPTMNVRSADSRMLFVLRGIAATEYERNQKQGEGEGEVKGQEGKCENEDFVSVVLYGSWESRGWGPLVESEDIEEEGATGQPDEILTFVVCVCDGSVRSSKHIKNADLASACESSFNASLSNENIRVSRIVLWPDDPASLAVSLISGHDSFGVHRLCVFGAEDDTQIRYSEECFGREGHPVSTVSCPPETCVQIAVIPAVKTPHTALDTEAANASDVQSLNLNSDVIIGLTARGKLYCGETLLVAGVSSFTLNNPLQVLLYISTGTKPLLHFCSFAALR